MCGELIEWNDKASRSTVSGSSNTHWVPQCKTNATQVLSSDVSESSAAQVAAITGFSRQEARPRRCMPVNYESDELIYVPMCPCRCTAQCLESLLAKEALGSLVLCLEQSLAESAVNHQWCQVFEAAMAAAIRHGQEAPGLTQLRYGSQEMSLPIVARTWVSLNSCSGRKVTGRPCIHHHGPSCSAWALRINHNSVAACDCPLVHQRPAEAILRMSGATFRDTQGEVGGGHKHSAALSEVDYCSSMVPNNDKVSWPVGRI